MKTTAKNFKNDKKEKKKLGLTTQIFIALLTGALLGVILCYLVPDSSFKNTILVDGILYVLGQGFIRLMKMLVVPLVFCSLVCGSMAIGDTQKLGSVGVRTILFYLVTTALAVAVALTVGNLLNPRHGPGYEHHPDQCFFCGKHGSRLPAGNPVEHHSGQSV